MLQCEHKVMQNNKIWNICANTKSTGFKFCRVYVLQELHILIVVMMSAKQHTHYQTFSFIKWKLPCLLLQSVIVFLVLCNVHICSHQQNEQQEQITLLEGGKLWFSHLNGEGLEPIVLPWKWYSGTIMELSIECYNCTKLQFYTEKVMTDVQFLVILHRFVSTLWHHKSSNLHESKSWITQQPIVLSR